jgi:hypothetical protein
MKKKKKSQRFVRIEDCIFYLSPNNSVLSRGALGDLVKCKILKSILPPKSPVRPDISGS